MIDMSEVFAIDLGDLVDDVAGPVALPGDERYAAEGFAWNLGFPQRPAVAVGATSAQDVQAAVRFAADRDLPVAVVSTGHGVLGTADGAVLINVRRLRDVVVDERARTATVGAGVEWQEVVAAAGKHGLAPLSGSSPNVGVVGYTLGGGLSPVLGRRYGWAADHVRSLELVTPDGELRTVTADSEPDLFWAVRGGKSNFGVVVSMTFGLVPVARFYGGGLYFDAVHAPELLEEFRRLATRDDDDLSVSVAFLRMPAAPFVPEPLRGRVIVHVRFSYLGSAERGAELAAPLRAVAPALIDVLREMPYTDQALVHSDPVDPMPAYERTALLTTFPPEAAEALVGAVGADARTDVIVVELRRLGGALSRPPQIDSAAGYHDAGFNLWVGTSGEPGRPEQAAASLDAVIAAMAPWLDPRTLINFMGAADADPERIAGAYQPEAYERLLRLKRTYDPQNLFRVNHVLRADRVGN